MRTLRHLTSSAALLAVTTAVGMVATIDAARAQAGIETAIPTPPVARPAVSSRAKSTPQPLDDAEVPRLLRSSDFDAVPALPSEAVTDREPGDGDDPARWDGRAQRGADEASDGASSYVTTDGRMDAMTEAGDGRASTRTAIAGDAAAEPSLSDFDRLAFQIELDPATDRRPARLGRFEPYAPKGLRAGTWVVLPEIETGIGSTSNAFRSTVRGTSFVFDARPTLRAVTDWRQHAIDVRATGLFSRYRDAPLADEQSYTFEARGRLDIGRRTSIEMLAAHRRDIDSVGDRLDPAAERGRPKSDVNQAAVAFNHRFNRLSIQLRGGLTDTDGLSGRANDGSLRTNAERDNLRRDAAIRASWEFKPSLAVFAEYAANTYDFRTIAADGFDRDSTGSRIRAGVSFGNTSAVWRGEVAIGHGRQDAKDSRLADADGIIIDANLAWRPSELTSLLFTAKSDMTTSTDPGQALGRVQSYGVEVRHAFRRHLIGLAGLRRQTTDYEGTAIKEVETTADLGAEYWLSQATSLSARYSHVRFDTTLANGDYTVDTARLGLRWRP